MEVPLGNQTRMTISLTAMETKNMPGKSKHLFPVFEKPTIAIVGGFGSGKTEVSVNLAKHLITSQSQPVTIADLDLVNPYFRSREANDEMESLGIKTIAPKGGQHYADLPILLPEIKGLLEKSDGISIIDVGGDAQGTRALGSLSKFVNIEKFDMLMVINSRRPQTENKDTCLKTMERIEHTAGLKFTGLISNTHLIDETTPEIIMEGFRLTSDVKRVTDLPIRFISAR